MTGQVLVRGFRTTWWIVLMKFAAAVAVAIGFFVLDGAVATALVVPGGFLALVAGYLGWHNARVRAWARDTGSGFTFIDRWGVREIADDEVAGLRTELRRSFHGGVARSGQRRLDVWIEGDPSPVRMRYRLKPGEADPLEPLMQRLTDGLAARSEAALERGEAVEGENWTLDRKTLSVGRGANTSQLKLDELAMVGVYDDRISIWIEGEESPSARVPVASRNAPVLLKLLESRIPERDGATPAAGEGLGRILFERKTSRTARFLTGLLGVLLAAVSAPVFPLEIWAGVAILGLGGGLFFWSLAATCFSCHEHGVRKSGLLRTREMRFDDVADFTYNAIRMYVNGMYTGTTVSFTFRPKPGTDAKLFRHTVQVRKPDEELDNLRDHIAKILARRLSESLERGESVEWTRELVLHGDALEHRPRGLLGGEKARRRIPYGDIRSFTMEDGFFHLWVHGTEKSVVQETLSAENFFPGFFAFVDILAAREGEDAKGDEVADVSGTAPREAVVGH